MAYTITVYTHIPWLCVSLSQNASSKLFPSLAILFFTFHWISILFKCFSDNIYKIQVTDMDDKRL